MPKLNILSFALVVGVVLVAAMILTRPERADVAQARGQVIAAQQALRAALKSTQSVLDRNKVLVKRADSARKQAAQYELRARSDAAALQSAKDRLAALPVPDTCATLVAAEQAVTAASEALTETRTRELSAALVADTVDRRRADSAEARLHLLLESASRLDTASTALAHTSKPGFFAKLRPTPFFGVEVGVDPQTKKISKTVGAGLGWRF